MFKTFHADTADAAWQKIAKVFRAGTAASAQISRAGQTREILHAAISIANPRERWVVSRTPPINPAFALAEVIWIMTGRNDSAFLNYFNSSLPKFAGKGSTYHGAYGYRLRRQLGVDQLDRAYNALKYKPESRQVVLQIWNGEIDLPRVRGIEAAADIPCNLVSMLKVRGGRLEWTQILRSNDVYRGLPYNFVQFTTMQEIMAGWLGLKLGSYNQVSDSLHVYNNDMSNVRESLKVSVVRNSDSLSLPKKQSDRVFLEMGETANAIIRPDTGARRLMTLARNFDGPTAYKNIISLLCAESARKRKMHAVAVEIMGGCDNPVYAQLFSRWSEKSVK